eukprot:6210028-Pleurochrysis_carterae.AAC.4
MAKVSQSRVAQDMANGSRMRIHARNLRASESASIAVPWRRRTRLDQCKQSQEQKCEHASPRARFCVRRIEDFSVRLQRPRVRQNQTRAAARVGLACGSAVFAPRRLLGFEDDRELRELGLQVGVAVPPDLRGLGPLAVARVDAREEAHAAHDPAKGHEALGVEHVVVVEVEDELRAAAVRARSVERERAAPACNTSGAKAQLPGCEQDRVRGTASASAPRVAR